MKILNWNVNGLLPVFSNAQLRHGSFQGFFKEIDIDIACFQEAKLQEKLITKEVSCIDEYQSFWACCTVKKGYSGVTTYCSLQYAPVAAEVDTLDDENSTAENSLPSLKGEGRILITDLGQDAFVLINVYVPNAGDIKKGETANDKPRLAYKLRFLRALRTKCFEYVHKGRDVLVCGDFNVALTSKDVHPTFNVEKLYSQEERQLVQSFLQRKPSTNTAPQISSTDNHHFIDVWRHFHPEEDSIFTVFNERTSARAFNQGLRIDYVLATPNLLQKIVSCEVLSTEILPPKWSDHSGILVELKGVQGGKEVHKCKEWLELHKRFHDPSQRSILSMFQAQAQLKKKRSSQDGVEKESNHDGDGDLKKQKMS